MKPPREHIRSILQELVVSPCKLTGADILDSCSCIIRLLFCGLVIVTCILAVVFMLVVTWRVSEVRVKLSIVILFNPEVRVIWVRVLPTPASNTRVWEDSQFVLTEREGAKMLFVDTLAWEEEVFVKLAVTGIWETVTGMFLVSFVQLFEVVVNVA